MSEKVIKVSEIATYVYCRRAWWLDRVGGYASDNVQELARGAAYHEAHGDVVARAGRAQMVAYALVFVAVGILAFLLIRGV